MNLSLIAAYDENKGVGIDNTLPWKISEDLKRFKALTSGKAIVMGRNTFVSLGRLLPNRKHLILSTDEKWTTETISQYPEVCIFKDIKDLFEYIEENYKDEEVFIIGGNAIWKSTINYVNKMYITHVKGSYTVDTYFPDWDESQWNITSREDFPSFSFLNYEK